MLPAIVALSLMFQPVSALADGPPPDGTWKTLATIEGVDVEDLSFVSAKIGYAAGGSGTFRTSDGGAHWSPSPYLMHHVYGVHALNADDVVASGFENGGTSAALIRWSHDGGQTWSDALTVSNTEWVWANRVYFWNFSKGFATTVSGNPGMFRTTTGGLELSDWTAINVDSGDGWFGAQFSALPNGHVRVSGINYCESLDFAATWDCRPSIDAVFDGATFFLDDKRGWVGGGAISIPTEGWVHRTTDGGATWSDRTLDSPWAVREIIFVNAKDGWAVGGAGDAGGAYVSHDGGDTWAVELDVGVGLTACSTADFVIFCAGYDNSFNSHFYSRDYDHIRQADFDGPPTP